MKKNFLQNTLVLRALVLSAIVGLLALAGCDTPLEPDDGNWLAKEKNPFIGTWGYTNTNMTTGVVTDYEFEFKTDGTIAAKTTIHDADTDTDTTTESTQYYLINDNYIVISGSGNTVYTKYRFQAPNNTQIALTATGNPTYYNRIGAENPNASRTLNLANGMEGYWRRDNLSFGTEEGAMFMYDWYTFNKNGTYHVYHYMDKNKHYIDRGEFSYYIDGSNRLVTINRLYDVTVYYDFTKTGNDAFSWAATSGGSTLGWERFDGETFWHSAE